MVTVTPLVRRSSFIVERVRVHAEELAYLWQRRRASRRSPELALHDFTYLAERIEAHLQGMLVAGEALGAMFGDALRGDDRDEVFAAAWALLRSTRPDNARRVLEAFAAATGPVIDGFADALAMAPVTHTGATLRAALAHGSPAHAAAAALALASHRSLEPSSVHFGQLLRHDDPAVAALAWRALLVLDCPPDAPRPPFAEALRRPVAALRGTVLDVAVWRGEAWVPEAIRRLAVDGDACALGWCAALCPEDEQDAVLDLIVAQPVPQRAALAARLGRPQALSAVLAWMADPDPVLAAAAGGAWERMTGLSVEGKRTALQPAAGADPIEQDFPVELWLPDLPRARAQWAENGARWCAGQRWCRGFDIQTALTSEARRWVDLEAFWDFGARAAFAGTRVFPPPPVV